MKTRQYNGGAGRSLTLTWAIPAEALHDVRECPSGGGIPTARWQPITAAATGGETRREPLTHRRGQPSGESRTMSTQPTRRTGYHRRRRAWEPGAAVSPCSLDPDRGRHDRRGAASCHARPAHAQVGGGGTAMRAQPTGITVTDDADESVSAPGAASPGALPTLRRPGDALCNGRAGSAPQHDLLPAPPASCTCPSSALG
jgi:hypothetical protein